MGTVTTWEVYRDAHISVCRRCKPGRVAPRCLKPLERAWREFQRFQWREFQRFQKKEETE